MYSGNCENGNQASADLESREERTEVLVHPSIS